MILAGDVGGTKTNLGLFERAGGRAAPGALGQVPQPRLPRPLGGDPRVSGRRRGREGQIEAACFGIPGPVIENRASTRTSPGWWTARRSPRTSRCRTVALINDLVATAEGIPLLEADELAVLQEGGPEPEGNRALIAAGTGLGMALLPRVGDRWVPVPSEGGHADYPPRTEDEIDLLRYLRERFGRVSAERVVSGPGLSNIYDFLRDARRMPESPAGARGARPRGGPGEGHRRGGAWPPRRRAAPSARGRSTCSSPPTAPWPGTWRSLGTATGGVYLGGGIAPKILPRLAAGPFLPGVHRQGAVRPLSGEDPRAGDPERPGGPPGAARHASLLLALDRIDPASTPSSLQK